MKILAIETSCDETSVAVVENGKRVLSNVISTQIDFHKKYGGIVPEIAARKHIEVISPMIDAALKSAKVKFKNIKAVAVTYGPGLIGSLLVGLCAAKTLAYSLKVPLIGVNHLEGHIYANFLDSEPETKRLGSSDFGTAKFIRRFQNPKFPFICLMVSGGHTMIVLAKDHGKYKVIGQTRDDAAGEAFDKVARFLGLEYPGGPIIDKLAKEGNPKAINFTRPMLEDGFDFSFSGIKTAVINHVARNPQPACSATRSVAGRLAPHDIAASFQQAVVDVLVIKTIRAAKKHKVKTICLAGGVAANSQLRKDLKEVCEKEKIKLYIPSFEHCTDNAAMIGAAAYYHCKQKRISDLKLGPIASLKLA